MSIKNTVKPIFPIKELEIVIRTLVKKYFVGNQPLLNSERVTLLEKNTALKQEIKRIRKLYSIPVLNPDKDIFTYFF